jgi:serine/threonine protein kinase
MVVTAPEGSTRVQPGQVLGGRYRIGRLLGEGGMGAVYEAHQLDLGRPVAIKVLSGSLRADAEALTRFEREARLAASIGHANIVAVHDLGKTDDGIPFIVMELLHGLPLAALLRVAAPLPFLRLAGIIDQVLAALEAAHAKGIIHRDIKPENIFVSPADEGDHVTVLDFGVSKVTGSVEKSLKLTRTGTVLGIRSGPSITAPTCTRWG